MRTIAMVCLVLALAGCTAADGVPREQRAIDGPNVFERVFDPTQTGTVASNILGLTGRIFGGRVQGPTGRGKGPTGCQRREMP